MALTQVGPHNLVIGPLVTARDRFQRGFGDVTGVYSTIIDHNYIHTSKFRLLTGLCLAVVVILYIVLTQGVNDGEAEAVAHFYQVDEQVASPQLHYPSHSQLNAYPLCEQKFHKEIASGESRVFRQNRETMKK